MTSKGYILKLSSERSALFSERNDDFFAEPVTQFAHGRGSPLTVFISDKEGFISFIASGRPSIKAGTGLRRLNAEKIVGLLKPLKYEEILKHIPMKVRRHLKASLNSGGVIPPESFKSLIESVLILDPTTKELFSRFSKAREDAIQALPENTIKPLADQKEAISTALHLAGIERDPLLGWTPVKGKKPQSFFEGLPSVYLREDLMIFNDMNHVPGLEKIRDFIAGTAVFENESVRLDVILANRTKLEEQTGTDLIYYNQTYNSFVMVQYKAMEMKGIESEPVFRLPDAQLAEEIKRMDVLLKKIMTGQPPLSRDGFRFSSNPFFIKVCPRIILKPDEVDLTPGMYFSLDHWKLLETDPDLAGPKGGRKISYNNVGRYFDNTEFSKMLQKAWVGTMPTQSSMLLPIIQQIIQGKKATIIAIKSDKIRSRDPDEEELGDLSF